MYQRVVKRGMDIVLSGLGLVGLSWLFLLVIIAIKIDDPGPAFFSQSRVGKNKKLFQLHKFRSMKMCTPKDTPTHLLENPEQYITGVGTFLRKSSLDELPQLWDMEEVFDMLPTLRPTWCTRPLSRLRTLRTSWLDSLGT